MFLLLIVVPFRPKQPQCHSSQQHALGPQDYEAGPALQQYRDAGPYQRGQVSLLVVFHQPQHVLSGEFQIPAHDAHPYAR
eukprot:CAMPEP_0196589722 /NCGR_PEP_ID=MMETSP1081-20130531/64389_1 /TAXON_ID=36882 /ORGANISM="Pyramimonas amylifera, Strain CCMP720" /LENGTH=79 /DNA_ID=CAMNT_0041912597 /DNA_START=72 /DNA_END=307 /DNA_ORIENTATION=+